MGKVKLEISYKLNKLYEKVATSKRHSHYYLSVDYITNNM